MLSLAVCIVLQNFVKKWFHLCFYEGVVEHRGVQIFHHSGHVALRMVANFIRI